MKITFRPGLPRFHGCLRNQVGLTHVGGAIKYRSQRTLSEAGARVKDAKSGT